MEEQSRRLRLIIEVLPLPAAETDAAHGFKGRKFALPVFAEQTIGDVWRLIEERYKRNYLQYTEAALFDIQKLQDAYECDLDVSDTVGAVFEGEHDNQMRMIKVVPTYTNRMASVPPTSNLRPAGAPKRTREHSGDQAIKRRRVEVDPDSSRNHPRASVGSSPDLFCSDRDEGTNERAATWDVRPGRPERSGTPESVVVIEQSRKGLDEFNVDSKEESPELGLPPRQNITPRSSSSGKKVRKIRSDKGKKRGPRKPATLKRPGRPARESKDAPAELPSIVASIWTKRPSPAVFDAPSPSPKLPGRLPRLCKMGSVSLSTVKHRTSTKEAEGAHSHATPGSIPRRGRPLKVAQISHSDIPHPTVERRGRPRKLTAPFVASSDDEGDQVYPLEPSVTGKNTTYDRETHDSPPAEINHACAEPDSAATMNNSVENNLVAGSESIGENGSANADNAVSVRQDPIGNDNASAEVELADDHDAVVGAEQTEDSNANLGAKPADGDDKGFRAMSAENDHNSVRAEPMENEAVAGRSEDAEEETLSNGANHAEGQNISRNAEPVGTNNDPVSTMPAEAANGAVQPERRMTRSVSAAARKPTAKEKANHHKEVMDSLFPPGYERPTRQWYSNHFYSKSKSRKVQKRCESEEDVESDQSGDSEGKAESQPVPTSNSARNPARFGSPDKDAIEDSQLLPDKEPVAATSKPQSLHSEYIDQQNETDSQIKTGLASASVSQPNSVHRENAEATGSEPEQETVRTDSKSNSALNSARSSPEAARPPARYLSRSPTPAESSSDEDSETSQSPRSQAGSSKIADAESDSDSVESSNEAKDETEEGSGYVNAREQPASHEPPELPSSLRQMSRPSTTLVPATQSSQLQSLSQRPAQGTPSLPPSNTPLASASQPTPLRRIPTRTPTARPIHRKFRSLSEQKGRMNAEKYSPAQPVKFDAKTQNLERLKNGAVDGSGDSDSGDDESSSSSDEEDTRGKTRSSCSVT